MKGPSIAVMLGAKPGGDDESSGDMSLSEAKAREEDAATAFADAVSSKDAKRIVKSFRALYDLCDHVRELEESGETEDDEKPDTDDDTSDDGDKEAAAEE